MLEQERKYFDRKRREFVSQHLGKFVLIKGNKLVGSFNTVEEALAEGARQFGLEPFLVRQISKNGEHDLNIPALTLGILNAHSTRSV